jgi:hypothetical protein
MVWLTEIQEAAFQSVYTPSFLEALSVAEVELSHEVSTLAMSTVI